MQIKDLMCASAPLVGCIASSWAVQNKAYKEKVGERFTFFTPYAVMATANAISGMSLEYNLLTTTTIGTIINCISLLPSVQEVERRLGRAERVVDDTRERIHSLQERSINLGTALSTLSEGIQAISRGVLSLVPPRTR